MRYIGCAVAVVAGVTLSAGPAGAQEQPQVGVSPASGAADDPFTVSGAGCVLPGGEHGGVVIVYLVEDGGPASDLGYVVAEDNGSWSLDTEVPADVPASSDYNVVATCWDDPEPNVLIRYAPEPFDVIESSTTTTTTTTRPTSTTTTEPVASTTSTTAVVAKPGTPAPAKPIVAKPNYNG